MPVAPIHALNWSYKRAWFSEIDTCNVDIDELTWDKGLIGKKTLKVTNKQKNMASNPSPWHSFDNYMLKPDPLAFFLLM